MSDIPLSFQMPRMVSPQEAQAQAMNLRAMMDERSMREAKMRQMQRAQEDEQALSDLYRKNSAGGQLDREGLMSGLAQSGRGHRIPGLMEQLSKADKAKSDAEKVGVEVTAARLKHVRDITGMLASKPGLTQSDVIEALSNTEPGMRSAAANIIRSMPPEGPALQRWAAGLAMNAKERFDAFEISEAQKLTAGVQQRGQDMTAQTAREGHGVTMRGQDINAKVTREGHGVTMRGQNMTDARAKDANSINAQGNVIKTETDLRKEFADLPEVKRYKAALPSFKAIESAAKTNNPQADINLIYGLAKLYDPESVVREGEYATIANSQAIPEWLKGMAQRVVGGGKLTPETKRQILEQARGRISTFENEYAGAKDSYAKIAGGRGANVENVFSNVSPSNVNRPPIGQFGGDRPPLSSFNR